MTVLQQNLLCLYRYDPLDRLISHSQSQASPLQRFYCKSRLATEIQGALHHSIVQHDDLLLAQQQRQVDVLDTTLLATDLQRSILQTLKANQPRHSIAYSPYGHRGPENGLLSLLGFNGERPDPVTGHYLLGNGYRAFNPVLMRFNSPDNWSPFGKGGLNSYAYCLDDPINFLDPTGQFGIGIALRIARWRGRAALMVSKQIKSAVELTRKRTVRIGTGLYSLKPGVKPLDAVKKIKQFEDLGALASHSRAKQGKYLHDLTLAKNQSALLEARTGKPASENERLKLLNYIKEYDGRFPSAYSDSKLSDAKKGIFDPEVRIHDRPSVRSAVQYYEELEVVNNPNFHDFYAEAKRVRDQAFTYSG
jgi:RHS repeat-associated protein